MAQFSSRAQAWGFSGVSKRIFKYAIDLDKREQEIVMPEFAEVLSAHLQYCDARVWALVDSDNELKPRKFFVLETGASVENPERLRFVGTILLQGGATVLHIFEETS